MSTPARAALTPADAARLVGDSYRHSLIQRLSLADEKADAWADAIERCPPAHRDALAFLLTNMPTADLKSLSPDRLLSEVEQAHAARAAAAWAQAVPDDIFLEHVLPYACTSEARDPWRQDFRDRFWPLVKDCRSAADAAQVLNREVFKSIGVAYHATKRSKPDQSPKESQQIGFASCTGLSIILIDACRSVGVPARLVGVPMWSDDSGNHTWVEIYDNGRWHFVGAAEPGPLDDTWFGSKAAKADATKPNYSVYAASFKRTHIPFPAVWAAGNRELYAENVTARYATPATVAPPAALVCLPVKPVDATTLDGDWATMAAITPKGYVCRRANGPITIDGRGSSPAWQAAAWTDDFVDIQGNARPAPRFRTRVKMLWDEQNLYVLAEMQEPHVWATITEKNKVIFHDNDFEIFIDPDGDHHRYHEFEVNARNTIWELTLPKPYRDGGRPIDPNNVAGLRSAVQVDGTLNDPRDTDKGWTVEVAIPWEGLAEKTGGRPFPPAVGDRWRVNFSRVQWLVDIIDGQYRKIPKTMRDEDNWVWSPTGVIDMHRPERWGVVQFAAGDEPFAADASQTVRDRLCRVYYRQQNFRKLNGRYATSPDELLLGPRQPDGLTLTTTAGGFMATIVDGTTAEHWTINELSHLTHSPADRP